MAIFQLPNPPAGFEFAKNGLGEQTGTLIKSASSILNDAAKKITSSIPKAPTVEFSIPNIPEGPTLADTMNAIKSGAINKDISASLTKISGVADSLPAEVNANLASAQATIAEKMAQAQADLPKLMAIAQANMDLTTKLAYANGAPPTEAQLKAASGALAIFQDGPKMLSEQASAISKSVAEAGKDFGAKLPAALETAGNFAKAGLDKITSLAKTAGASVTSFASSVPAQTIPDPLNPSGPAIPNPAYATFAADPSNASKLASLSNLTASMNTAAAGLTSAFGAIESQANAALSGGITDLKAFGFAAALAQPAGGIMGVARSAGIDTSFVNPLQINKVIAQAAASNPAQPPKADDAKIKATKVKESSEASAPAVPPKKAIFGENPNEKISSAFVTAYANHWAETNVYYESLERGLKAKLDGWYPNYSGIKARAEQIVTEKPDAATRTTEEQYYVEKREKLKAITIEWFKYFKNFEKVGEQQNVRADQYNLLKNLYQENKTYGDCPLTIQTAISTSAVLSDEEEAKYFDTYADFAKAKPGEALPDSLNNPFSG